MQYNARLAQLDRAADYESAGCRFDSYIALHIKYASSSIGRALDSKFSGCRFNSYGACQIFERLIMFRFVITNMFEGAIEGTDDEQSANDFSFCDDFFVYDTRTGKWIIEGKGRDIKPIRK